MGCAGADRRLIQAGGLNFWPIWIAGSVGAALGDWLSYWIGCKLEGTVQHIWPLSRHPDLIPRGEPSSRNGRGGHFHRALLRSAACRRAAGGGHFRDAVLAFSIRQFHLGLRLGRCAADDRRRVSQLIQMFWK